MNSLGAYQVQIEPLADGVYNITTTYEDLAGNVSAPSAPLKVTIAKYALNLPGGTSDPASGDVTVNAALKPGQLRRQPEPDEVPRGQRQPRRRSELAVAGSRRRPQTCGARRRAARRTSTSPVSTAARPPLATVSALELSSGGSDLLHERPRTTFPAAGTLDG